MNKHALDMLSAIQARKPGHTLARDFYINQERYQLDLQHIWYRSWVFAGHTIELEKPGQYITLQIGDYPILIIRNRDHQINAFHNICRHRGAVLCQQAAGKTHNLICPYHQWSYNLNGELFSARSISDDVDFSHYSLKPIQLEQLGTQIYVCLADDPPSFDEFTNIGLPYVEPYDVSNCKIAHQTTQIENANWKIVFENNRECYHCHVGHPELSIAFVDDLAGTSSPDGLDTDLVNFWQRCEQAGLPSQGATASDHSFRFMRAMLAEGTVSYTMDGKAAVNRQIHNTGVESSGALLYYHYPSTWNHFLGDHTLSFRVLPISPTQTQLTTKWLVHKDAVQDVDYDLNHLIDVWEATNKQDKNFVEMAQQGVNSPSYEPGPLSHTEEIGVSIFVQWYCDTISRHLNGESEL